MPVKFYVLRKGQVANKFRYNAFLTFPRITPLCFSAIILEIASSIPVDSNLFLLGTPGKRVKMLVQTNHQNQSHFRYCLQHNKGQGWHQGYSMFRGYHFEWISILGAAPFLANFNAVLIHIAAKTPSSVKYCFFF